MFDLQPDPSMTPLVSILHATVEDAFGRLTELVSDLSLTEFEYKGPSGELNSSSQIVRHLLYVDIRWLYRIRGEAIPGDLEAQFGPFRDGEGRLPRSEGRSPAEMLAQNQSVLSQFRTVCQGLIDEDLSRRYLVSGGAEVTLRWGLWHMADHSRFHQGQIAWLKNWARK